MPQQERSHNLLKMLKYLRSLKLEGKSGASTGGLKAHTRNEITELGATDKTIENYIETLKNAGLIDYSHPYWRITKAGEDFLERHGE